MAGLIAAVVVLGLFCVLNAVFCLGIVRRLREHTELIGKLGKGSAEDLILGAGATAADFTASTVDGDRVSRDALGEPTLVAFLMPGCAPCTIEGPKFVAMAADHPGGRERVLAVVVGSDDDEAAPVVAELRNVATVVREEDGGPVQKAFAVTGFPAFALVAQGGVLLAGENMVNQLPAPVPA